MLCLMRKNGQWVEITHAKSGEVIKVRVQIDKCGSVKLVFLDDDRNFEINRPERKDRPYTEENGK